MPRDLIIRSVQAQLAYVQDLADQEYLAEVLADLDEQIRLDEKRDA